MVFDDPVDQVWATLHVDGNPGLYVDDEQVKAPEGPVHDIYLPTHSEVSDRNRDPIAQVAKDPVMADHEGLGLYLGFDRLDIPIRRGWFGPTEAVIDDLVPWFGTYTSRGLIADHRLREIRIVRGLRPGSGGVRVAAWYVTDQEVNGRLV